MAEYFYCLDVENVFKELNSSPKGLSEEEAKARLKKYGYNELTEKKKASALHIFLSQFKNIFMVILILGVILSVGIGFFEAQTVGHSPYAAENYVDAIAIGVIVVLNSVIGFVQEYRSEKAMEAMKKLASPKARALRNGTETMIPAREVTLGDVLVLEAGDCAPADGRLIEAKDLRMMEAVLTGESTPVTKTTDALAADVPLAERSNMIFIGTCASSGRAKAHRNFSWHEHRVR